jgi:hypothetical protein
MTSISIHVEREHSCGQVFEEILHVESADFSLDTDYLALWRGSLEKEPLQPFTLPEPPVTKLTFTGVCGKVEAYGMAWVPSRGLICMRCGADLLFGEKQDESQND